MKCSVVCMILFAFAAIKEVESKCGCRVPFKFVGCYKDKRSNRALPEQLINERDVHSAVYNGYDIDWFNWNEYLPAFTCRCAEAAMKKGYKFFGLQFWGECWSGPSPAAADTYNKHGKGNNCYGLGYKKCTSSSDNCVGANHHNFIYEIETYDCPVKFDRLGCYRDRHHRALPDYTLTDRDTRHAVSSGHRIDWFNYDTYLPDFACRCAKKAVEKGHNTFGLQYYGECFSGANGDTTYFKDGGSSQCINRCYEPCRNYDNFCIGKRRMNFVYRVSTDVCELNYTTLGCYGEDTNNRALNELIMDDVNPQSNLFTGIVSTDVADWGKYMKGLICRCARKIKEKGYTTFGITNGGECWSGANAQNTYDDYGGSNHCYYEATTPCSSSTTCAGGPTTTFVFQLRTSEIRQ